MTRQPGTTDLRGLAAAFATPLFLGMAPIFGKLAINAGADSFTVAAIRTVIAVLILWGFYALFFRKFIYIYPAGLLGCIVIGTINGIGSLFYYGGLGPLDASMAQLLNGMYLPLAVLLSRVGGQKPDWRTLVRVTLAMVALALLAGFGAKPLDWAGAGLMLGSALMFAGTVILSQYILYEMPAPTVALYVLTTMGVVVAMFWVAVGMRPPLDIMQASLWPILLLGITTALSRLAMFVGVKFMGGTQTAILAIAEIGVALALAFVFLGDRLTTVQTVGVGFLTVAILLIRPQDMLPHGYNPNALIVANMASVQFQRIAFHRAFGTTETDNEAQTMANLTTAEMLAIQRMMGAQLGGIDPFPITKSNRMNLDVLPEDLFETQEFEVPEELRRDGEGGPE